MLTNPVQQEAVIQAALGDLTRLRRFSGPPAEFWPSFLKACSNLTGACKGTLLLRDPKQPETWRKMSEWTGEGHADRSIVTFTRLLIEIGERTATASAVLQLVENGAKTGLNHYALAIRLTLTRPEDVCIAIFYILNVTEAQANEGLVRLQLISDTPASYLLSQSASQSKADVEKFASSLDLMVLVNAEKEFLGASLAFCNGLATRFGCDRVTLGWIEKGYIKLKSISHTERFDRNMAAVKSLEMIMEESFDQDEEIIWPVPDGSSYVVRDHERFARDQGVGNIASFPLRLEGKNLGVITCERPTRPFDELDLQQIRLACDQAIRRLADLKEREGWFGPRLLRASREKLAGLVGPEHTWAKVLAIGGSLLLAILFFVPVPYRVEGRFILRSDRLFYMTGPFDGFIKEVFVRPGDQVTTNTTLLTMDTNELLLEESGALADQARYLREADKARATNGLAEMQISLALADQTKAHLDAVRYRIQQSTVKAPITGVVVEGDLRERIGAPVKQGEALFKVARTDTLYVETEITQKDIHEIAEARNGQIAFVTRPRMKFPIQVARIEPAAFPKEAENIFIVRCALLTPPSDWWRPGMSGLCKISAGKRTLFWILTHRTVDFLRLKFWW